MGVEVGVPKFGRAETSIGEVGNGYGDPAAADCAVVEPKACVRDVPGNSLGRATPNGRSGANWA
jgi:hypothetical protein